MDNWDRKERDRDENYDLFMRLYKVLTAQQELMGMIIERINTYEEYFEALHDVISGHTYTSKQVKEKLGLN